MPCEPPPDSMKRSARILLSLLAGFTAVAAETPPPSSGSAPDLSLEDLVNIKVTSVSKRETNLDTSPAAIYVITQDDIRHSGLSSIPELLRMVPGLNVARVDGSQWAISSRGFNGQFANKLLVLVDGRAVYTPTFGGVFWNAQDVVLENLDRIEVIRGPGASLWGANAVNGVINITTKSAKDTQGGLISVSAGTEDQPSTIVQYGGQLATNLYYRVYVKYFNREGLVDSAGRPSPDDWRSVRTGARLDWELSPSATMTVQGDYYDNRAGGNIHEPNLTPPLFFQSVNLETHNNGGNVLGRWTQNFSETSQLTLQVYFDHFKQEYGFTKVLQDTFDIDLQHRFSLGPRNDLVWGAGYRLTATKVTPSFFAEAVPESRQFSIYNAFLQDDLTVVSDRLHLILGAKVEHNEFTGWELQPNGRLLWTPREPSGPPRSPTGTSGPTSLPFNLHPWDRPLWRPPSGTRTWNPKN
jgi:iron complex outermembrane receptor protein